VSGPAAPLLLLFYIFCAIGIVAALALPQRRHPVLIALFGSLAALSVLAAGAALLIGGSAFRVELWPLLSLGTLTLRGDTLSGLFIFVSGLVFLPVSIFSAVYLPKYMAHYSLRYFSILYYALIGSIVLVLIAGDVISFLVAWEAMTIASYLGANYEHEHDESSRAAFVMLAMSEAGAIAVVVAFILIGMAAASLDFAAIGAAKPDVGPGLGWAIFLLSFFGFAVKAGLVPVGGWLPLAHPVAPTNVSALLSAVIVNLGIYGIIRVNLDLLPATGDSPGLIVLVIGALSALIGILYATTQAELKRLLAHSTIENMGIVAAGIGAAMTFVASGHRVVAAVALVAALYHLANHSVYKALLFVGTGAVEAGAGTRDLDLLGGIARRMPWTSALFLIGVLSIAALPPLNGFVSEWLTLQTILRSTLIEAIPIKVVFALAGALLALTAGLAATCFAKVFAMGFLGMPRSEGAAAAKDSPVGAHIPLGLLAAFCIALGVLPTYVIPALDRAVVPLAHESAVAALVPPFFGPPAAQQQLPPAFLAEFHDLGAQVGDGIMPGRGLVVLHRGEEQNPVVFAMSTSYTVLGLGAILLIVFVVFKLATRGRALARGAVWAGGLRKLTPEITYTATGYSNPVRVIFHAIVNPTVLEDRTEAVAHHFRTAIRREYAETHIIDRFVLEPPVRILGVLAGIVRRMHVGNVNAYAGYVLLAMLLALLIGSGIR
jgi:hydrogenase-4 component B